MKTQKKRPAKKKHTIFQTGNIIICTRLSIVPHIKSSKNNKKGKIYGGESDNEYLQQEIFVNLLAALDADDKNDPNTKSVKEYLESLKLTSDKAGLLKFIFKQQSNRDFDDFFDKMKTRKLDMRNFNDNTGQENKIYVLLENKVMANKEVKKIAAEINKIEGLDAKTKEDVIHTLEHGSSMSVYSVSSSALNSLKSASAGLSAFMVPTPSTKKDKHSETNIEILFFNKQYPHFKKGDSIPSTNEKQFGDFVVLNRPTRYANTAQYTSDMTGSVEDLLAGIATAGENLLCIGNSQKCEKYSVKRKPYMTRVMRIVNKHT